jgi:HSP20 family protein
MARLPARSSGRNMTVIDPSRECEDIYDRMGQLVNVALALSARPGSPSRSSRRTGRFEYRATVPGDINPEGVIARLADGVLTETVLKSEAARPREIEVSDN